ncbi:MAG: hypothetical protein R3D67_07735 [Hyphomicrobiaceae bacterium]
MRRLYPDVHTPAISTVHAVLDRNGLVPRRPKRRRNKATGTERHHVEEPSQLWCADYKGSSCWPTGATATRSRSPTMPAAI